MAKMPRSQLREKLKLEAQLNVRQVDFGLRDAARASADLGEENAIDISLPGEGEKKGNKKGAHKKGDQATDKETPPPPPPEEPDGGDAGGEEHANEEAPGGEVNI